MDRIFYGPFPLLFLLYLSTNVAGNEVTPRSNYGEHCNKTQKCQRGVWLTCDYEKEVCICAKGDQMEFNEEKGKCVAHIGETCRFLVSADSDEAKYEESDCVTGAFCKVSEGLCTCLPRHYEDPSGICFPLKNHTDICNSASECAYDKFMTCVGGSCLCENQEKLLYDSAEGTCKIRAGKACNLFDEQIGIAAACVEGSECSGGVCSCPSGKYVDKAEGICSSVKGMGALCSYNEECDPSQHFACVRGSCTCDPKKTYKNGERFTLPIPNSNCDRWGNCYYGNSKSHVVEAGQCLMKAGQFCFVESTGERYDLKSDPKNRYCIRNSKCSSNTCVCEDGYERTADGMCGKSYNGECSESQPCNDKFRCVRRNNGKATCICPNTQYQIFDSSVTIPGFKKSGACVDLVGSPCRTNDNLACVKYAKCIGDMGGYHRCECTSGTLANAERRCEVGFGFQCDLNTNSTTCDSIAKLECRAFRVHDEFGTVTTRTVCACPNEDDIYEKDRRKCSRPVGVMCLNNDECVKNAICQRNDLRVHGRCICEDGYSISETFECIIPPTTTTATTTTTESIAQNPVNNDTTIAATETTLIQTSNLDGAETSGVAESFGSDVNDIQ